MNNIEFSGEQQALLRKFSSIGGVIEFSLAYKPPFNSEFELHKKAAILTLTIAQKRMDDYFDELIRTPEYKNRDRNEFFKVVFDESKINGHKVSLDAFLGTQYHLPSRRIIVRGKTPNYLNSYFMAGDAEMEKNVISIYSETESPGFSNAFLEPPYGLRGTALQLQEIFDEIENKIFYGFQEFAEIWCWSDECSNYFDAGRDWWGNYFYTYSNPTSDRILGIIASTTD